MQYERFGGLLPNITRVYVQFIGLSFKARGTSTFECLARSTTTNPMLERIIREPEGIIHMNSDETIRIPGTGEFCTFALSYEGEARLTDVLTGESIQLRLI